MRPSGESGVSGGLVLPRLESRKNGVGCGELERIANSERFECVCLSEACACVGGEWVCALIFLFCQLGEGWTDRDLAFSLKKKKKKSRAQKLTMQGAL